MFTLEHSLVPYFDDEASIDEFHIVPVPTVLIEKVPHLDHHSGKRTVFIVRSRKSPTSIL